MRRLSKRQVLSNARCQRQRKFDPLAVIFTLPLTTTPSKDVDARWIKKNGQYKLGYRQHTGTEHKGYIDKLHVTPANAHACKHVEVLLDAVDDGVLVHADKGYSSSENRQHLAKRGLRDGIMHKANRGQALTAA